MNSGVNHLNNTLLANANIALTVKSNSDNKERKSCVRFKSCGYDKNPYFGLLELLITIDHGNKEGFKEDLNPLKNFGDMVIIGSV